MDNLYVMSLLSVSILSELHLFKKQRGSSATGELKWPDAMPDDAIRVVNGSAKLCTYGGIKVYGYVIDSYQKNGGKRLYEDAF